MVQQQYSLLTTSIVESGREESAVREEESLGCKMLVVSAVRASTGTPARACNLARPPCHATGLITCRPEASGIRIRLGEQYWTLDSCVAAEHSSV